MVLFSVHRGALFHTCFSMLAWLHGVKLREGQNRFVNFNVKIRGLANMSARRCRQRLTGHGSWYGTMQSLCPHPIIYIGSLNRNRLIEIHNTWATFWSRKSCIMRHHTWRRHVARPARFMGGSTSAVLLVLAALPKPPESRQYLGKAFES